MFPLQPPSGHLAQPFQACTDITLVHLFRFLHSVSYSTNQIHDLMDRYTAIPYGSCTYRCCHSKQCCMHLLTGLNYLEQRDGFEAAPNKILRNVIQMQAETYRSM